MTIRLMKIAPVLFVFSFLLALFTPLSVYSQSVGVLPADDAQAGVAARAT